MARRLVVFSFVAALAVFCIVQDRVTAAGATRYAEMALAAIASQQPVTPVDAVMQPAIRRSVRLGLASAGVVLVVGLAAAAGVSRIGRAPAAAPGRGEREAGRTRAERT